jgi:AAA15 family ATPase/GTPase
MLIEFTVENYRSIKEPVTLSTVAASSKRPFAKTSKRRNVKPDHEIAAPFRDKGRNLELLPVIGIFGANASGKSNVIQALNLFLLTIWLGATPDRNSLTWFIPFGLTDLTKEFPTRFEMRIIRDGTIFTYTLVLNRTRILQEKLEHIPPPPRRMQNRLLFNRVWQEDQKAYIFTNGKDFGNAYREIQGSLREHEPFMSLLATRLKVDVVQPFTSWLTLRLVGVSLGEEQFEFNMAAQSLQDDSLQMLELVTQIIRRFDTGVAGIDIEKVESDSGKIIDEYKVWVLHETNSKQVRWPMEEESTGTQRLFGLAYKLLFAFSAGTLLLIDELGSNIHPNITRAIVRMFQSEKTNPKRAQLIFTSHDNTLHRGNLLRRDQIWFTQKRTDGSTELYSLSDFRPRNDLAIDKAYLDGRFGAVPILPDEEELLELTESMK